MKGHLGFKVRQHNPWRIWAWAAFVVALLGAMFFMGHAYQSYELLQYKIFKKTLETRVEELKQRNTTLVKKNAQLEGASKIEHDAYEQAKQSLVTLEKEILGMKEQLVFYQGIVSPEKLALGINIQSLELNKRNDDGLYGYKLVLTKRGKSSQVVKGAVDILLKGQMNGTNKELGQKKLKQDYNKNDFKFSFRYFQVFEGEMLLPDHFEPYDIELVIKPSTRKIKKFSETFSWAQALSGGNT